MIRDAQRAESWPSSERSNHEAALGRLRQRGWIPRCIYDVGASNGAWAATTSRIFPLAEFHLFEPLARAEPSYHEILDWMARQPGARINVHAVALDSSAGTRRMGLGVHPMGSSLLATQESEWFPRVIDVRAETLDGYVREHRLPPADMVKLDTQGSEMRILSSGEDTIRKASVLVVETWLERGYGPATPLLHEMVAWLAEREFFVADTAGEYREGHRLVALDLLFIRSGALIDSRP